MPAETSLGRPLKVGVQLPEVERVAPWSDLARMATTAEALGYDSVWVCDHLIFRDGDKAPPAGHARCARQPPASAAISRSIVRIACSISPRP